ncbi:MAG TPA: hypothetical protein ENG45_00255 [Candidatus Aenigmarchaeota archaeon]|nr:hypothetical protein [Candidatus Aenigmarchaeota archaeon]
MKKKLFKDVKRRVIIIVLLLSLMYIAFWTRSATLKSEVILDYDPWYFYRLAETILKNNLKPPKWDLLSFFPPGRPFHKQLGWPYTMILFYKIQKLLNQKANFMETAKLAPALVVSLCVIPSFLLGKLFTNEWGGLLTSLFIVFAPAFIGVSMAGYCDTDAVVVMYTFLTVFSILLAVKKNKIHYYIFSSVVFFWFVYNWWFAWYIILYFTLFIPGLLLFRVIERSIREKRFALDLKATFEDSKPVIIPLFILILLVNVVGTILGLGNLMAIFGSAFRFLSGKAQIVNVSVAELQPVNVFTKNGFLQIAGRAGIIPTALAIFGLPVLVFYKILQKVRINFIEIFLFVWMFLTFYLIIHGVRFSLLFSCAVAASAGYVLGNLIHLVKSGKNLFIKATVFGIVAFLSLSVISDAAKMGQESRGMEVEKEWLDMLDWLKKNADPKAIVATWWDPGHIIAGYTGLRVHADGAHCGPGECVPYNHNIRIKDMGKVLVTNDEKEAVRILKKYMQLTPQQCEEVKKKYDGIVPKEACEPASEMYFIASNDLIFKYPWHSYFGDWNNVQKQYLLLSFSKYVTDEQGRTIGLSYGDDLIILLFKGDRIVPILQKRYVVKELLYYRNGKLHDEFVENGTVGSVLLLGDIENQFPSQVVFMPIDHEESKKFIRCQESSCEDGKDNNFNRLIDEKVTFAERDSMFTKMFFLHGEELKCFKLVYENDKIRLFKVDFGCLE